MGQVGNLPELLVTQAEACPTSHIPFTPQETKTIERQQRVNEQIRVPQVRVISTDGEQLGILDTDEALTKAREAELDLVEVAPNERPPVCRIMDYGKYKYQQNKRKNKGHVHHTKNKEIRLRPKTDKHDLDFKVNRARTFLEHKDKVIISVVFRGRENAHMEEGYKQLNGFVAQLQDVATVEQGPSQQGRRIVLILAPK